MDNQTGAYALYEFLKQLVNSGELKAENDNSEIYFTNEDGICHLVTDYSFDDGQDLMFW